MPSRDRPIPGMTRPDPYRISYTSEYPCSCDCKNWVTMFDVLAMLAGRDDVSDVRVLHKPGTPEEEDVTHYYDDAKKAAEKAHGEGALAALKAVHNDVLNLTKTTRDPYYVIATKLVKVIALMEEK